MLYSIKNVCIVFVCAWDITFLIYWFNINITTALKIDTFCMVLAHQTTNHSCVLYIDMSTGWHMSTVIWCTPSCRPAWNDFRAFVLTPLTSPSLFHVEQVVVTPDSRRYGTLMSKWVIWTLMGGEAVALLIIRRRCPGQTRTLLFW